jgi:predicted DNA-binding protein (UPF0251 family)
MKLDEYLSINEAAALIGVEPITVWRNIKAGHLKAKKFANVLAIKGSDVITYINAKSAGLLPGRGRPRKHKVQQSELTL